MSNSKLVDYTNISPNKNPRKDATYNPSGKVIKITPHHVAGNVTVERLGESFAKESRQASSNYGIGTDGRVGLYVPEDCRAWTSGGKGSDRGKANDFLAVTIEVANDGGAPDWHVSDKALAKLIDLCVDICQRNGIKKLNYTGDASGNLTRHNMFAATTCPGPYLQSKFPYIAEQVNKILNETADNTNHEEEGFEMILNTIKKGSTGGQVAAMQAMLIGFGYSVGDAGADGYFGEATENALKKYQTQHNLEVDGICGPNTWTSLFSADNIADPEKEWIPEEGDIVWFNGGVHYSNANAASGSKAAAGQAKISKIAEGKKHPYSLVRTGKTGPYGWVDAGTFTKV